MPLGEIPEVFDRVTDGTRIGRGETEERERVAALVE
jgi:hypothetical protein